MTPARRAALLVAVMGRSSGPVQTQAEAYLEKIASYSPFSHWPLDDAAGQTVARNTVNAAFNGTYSSNAIPGVAVGPDGGLAPTFVSASTHRIGCFSAALATAFTNAGVGAQGSLLEWWKVSGAGVWTDGAGRFTHYFGDALENNTLANLKSTVNNRFDGQYKAGNVLEDVNITSISTTLWVCMVKTWDRGVGADGEAKFYLDGVQQGPTRTSLGTWVDPLAFYNIGSLATAGSSLWSGSLRNHVLFDRVLTQPEAADLANPT